MVPDAMGAGVQRVKESAEVGVDKLRKSARSVSGLVERHVPDVEAQELKESLKEGGRRAGETAKTLYRRGRESLPSIEMPRRKESSMLGKVFDRFTIGFGLGYVLGARAGKERYQEIQSWWNSFLGNPTVQQATERGKELVTDAGRTVAERAHLAAPQSIKDVMTSDPRTIKSTSTIADAAHNMAEHDVGAMVVVDASDKVVGIVTDRDIAIRVVSEGRDPKTAKVSEVASKDLTTLSPQDSVAEAVRVMRDKAIRRLPVVENGRPVGIVSIGDLAIERDSSSALAEISAKPGNR